MSVTRALEEVRRKILASSAKSGRPVSAGPVRLVCVTKGISQDYIKRALAAGISDIGESRVQETSVKRGHLGA